MARLIDDGEGNGGEGAAVEVPVALVDGPDHDGGVGGDRFGVGGGLTGDGEGVDAGGARCGEGEFDFGDEHVGAVGVGFKELVGAEAAR